MEMQNDYEIEDFSNAKGWFKKAVKNLGGEITKLVKDPKGTLQQAGHRAVDVTKDTVKNLAKETAKVGSKAWKAFKKFNPLSVAARAGTLVAFRLNLNGMSKRLYPSVKSDGAAWKKTADFWKNVMGGKPDELKRIVEKAKDTKIFRLKKSSFDGTDEYSNIAGVDDAALISAALAVIGKIADIMKKNGADGDAEDPAVDEVALQEVADDAKGDIEKGSQDEDSDLTDDGIMGIPKPYFWGGVAVLGIIAIITTIIIIKKKK